MKKRKESLNTSNNSIVSKSSSRSASSLHPKKEENSSGLKPLVKQFFDLRGHLLQWHFLNSDLKQKIKLQAEKQQNEFFNRFMQIINLQNSEKELKMQIDYKIAIKHLEDVLKIEFPTIKEVYPKLDYFIEFSNNLSEYLSSSLKKLFLGEGIVIDVAKMNTLIGQTETLFDEIFTKHHQFFTKYGEIKTLVNDNLKGLKGLAEEIRDFCAEVKGEEKEMNLRVCERILGKQDEELSALEKEFLS